jgi:hypothetical protein
LLGLNTAEPVLFAQGFTITENTIQLCKEAAIVGKNVQVLKISGNYTEGNCAGPYTNLSSSNVLNTIDMNGAEIIITSSNVNGSSKIDIQNNWFWINKSTVKSPLAIKNCFGIIFMNNSVYSTEYLEGPRSIPIIVEGLCGKLNCDQTIKILGLGSYTPSNLYGNKSNIQNKFLGEFNSIYNLIVPNSLSQCLFIPFENVSNIMFGEIWLSCDSNVAQSVSIGIYESYLGSVVRTVYQDNINTSFDQSRKLLKLKLNSKYILGEGSFVIAIAFKGLGNVPILVLPTLADFTRKEEMAFVANLDFVNASTFFDTSISSYIQPPQIFLV